MGLLKPGYRFFDLPLESPAAIWLAASNSMIISSRLHIQEGSACPHPWLQSRQGVNSRNIRARETRKTHGESSLSERSSRSRPMKPVHIVLPVYLFLAIVIMVLLHFLIPGSKVLALPWSLSGLMPISLGIGMNLVADSSFKKHETTVKPLEKPTALITTGPFRVSRHPMYVGFVLVLFGIALLMGSLTPYAAVFVFAVFMDIVFIRLEEKELEDTFGEAWFEYKRKVRRWI